MKRNHIIVISAIAALLLIVGIVIVIWSRQNNGDPMAEESRVEIKYNWDIRTNPAWINFTKDQLIGDYNADTVATNSEYCFDLCNNNKRCNAYLYNTKSTKCKLLNVAVPEKQWPSFRTNVSPNGVWGGGVKVQ